MPMETARRWDGLTAFWLHILAMGFMLIDHTWAMLMPGQAWMNAVGRLAFPIFAFLLAEGFHYTKSRKRYLLRLLGGALLSEIPFNLMIVGAPFFPLYQNVIWTFLIGFLCMWGIDWVRRRGRLWLTLPAALVIGALGTLLGFVLATDYAGFGVLTVLLFYLLRGRRWWQLLGQAAGLFCLNWLLMAGVHDPVTLIGTVYFIPRQGLAVLALIPIWLYRGRQGYHSRWFQMACYLFYPAHMLALALFALYR